MIVTPKIFTPVHTEEVVSDNNYESVNEETLTKIAENHNWIVDIRPIGSIIFFNVNQPGSTPPDESLYQQCDGAEITNPNSPLRSIGVNQNFVPDFRDRYCIHEGSFSSNSFGGSQEHNLEHKHTTGGRINLQFQIGLEDKGNRRKTDNHSHDMSTQYSNPTYFDAPAYIYLIPYMKIV